MDLVLNSNSTTFGMGKYEQITPVSLNFLIENQDIIKSNSLNFCEAHIICMMCCVNCKVDSEILETINIMCKD